jgi:hypothetical protein
MFAATEGICPYLMSYGFNTIWKELRKSRHCSQAGTATMHTLTRSIIGLTLLASSGVAIASMISGTIEWPEDGVRKVFYQEDIWQIIADITPDTRAEKKLLSRNDKKFVKLVGKYQKKITKLENKSQVRELNEKQASRLQNWEDRLLQLLNSRNLLDPLLLAGLNDTSDLVLGEQTGTSDLVLGEQTGSGINDNDSPDYKSPDYDYPDYASHESQQATGVPEPSTLVLLGVGLLCLGVANGRHARLPG